ncbi:MAG: hypothetical protein WD009_14330 [Phycisphaeraceae bacterium]
MCARPAPDNAPPAPATHDTPLAARAPFTLWLGLAALGVFHALIWLDVQNRAGVIIPWDAFRPDVADPDGRLNVAARYVAANMTPLCWVAYLLVADGLLTHLARIRRGPLNPIRARPNRFLVAWLTSIPVWCFFDWVNFTWLDAWRYHGLPEPFAARVVGYLVAFAAIVPGMLLAAQLYQHLGLARLRIRPGRGASALAWIFVLAPPAIIIAVVLTLLAAGLGPADPADPASPADRGDWLLATSAGILILPGLALGLALPWPGWRSEALSLGVGVGFVAFVFYARDPIANLTLWVGLIYLLDPINRRWLGQPSLLGDWVAGRLGRTVALFAAGLTCGLLWEFWNYYALAKWTYNLPFLGPLQAYRYFEMPWPGMLGFLPFAAECWVVLHAIIGLAHKLPLRLAEPLPAPDRDVL